MTSNLPRNVRKAMEASCRGLDHRVALPSWALADPVRKDEIIEFLAAVRPAGDASAMPGEDATTVYCFRRALDAEAFQARFVETTAAF